MRLVVIVDVARVWDRIGETQIVSNLAVGGHRGVDENPGPDAIRRREEGVLDFSERQHKGHSWVIVARNPQRSVCRPSRRGMQEPDSCKKVREFHSKMREPRCTTYPLVSYTRL